MSNLNRVELFLAAHCSLFAAQPNFSPLGLPAGPVPLTDQQVNSSLLFKSSALLAKPNLQFHLQNQVFHFSYFMD